MAFVGPTSPPNGHEWSVIDRQESAKIKDWMPQELLPAYNWLDREGNRPAPWLSRSHDFVAISKAIVNNLRHWGVRDPPHGGSWPLTIDRGGWARFDDVLEHVTRHFKHVTDMGPRRLLFQALYSDKYRLGAAMALRSSTISLSPYFREDSSGSRWDIPFPFSI